ncbi:MAG: ribosome biogenesis GTP-binding protein YihA/YsxC [Synergistaceae bacterium]|nr:ribosome biogenesis GTP-binding protein YihA/YsxC [Synergistaceae bacterium]
MSVWKSELFCTAFNKQQLPPPGPHEIVFVGRSNVGKSTLINALLGRKLAKVSSKPGKTRSINFYNVEAEPHKFSLVDLPGYGYAARGMDERKSWWKLIDDYFSQDRPISYVVHLIDFRHGPLANDNELTACLDRMDMPRIVVFTKGDKISPGKRKGQYNTIMRGGIDSILPPFVTSGVNDAEMEKLRTGIEEVLSEIIKLDAQEAR